MCVFISQNETLQDKASKEIAKRMLNGWALLSEVRYRTFFMLNMSKGICNDDRY